MAMLTTYEHSFTPPGMKPLRPNIVFLNHADFTFKVERGMLSMLSESRDSGNVKAQHEMHFSEAYQLASCILMALDAHAGCQRTDTFQLTDGQPFDLVAHIHRQREFSENTFGPGARTAGVIDHIRKELREVENDPTDLNEWIDIVLLALDGAWRSGHSPKQICEAIAKKQIKNEQRQWPDWRTSDPSKAIEHVRGEASQ